MSKTTSSSPPEPLQGRNENHAAWLLRRIWDRVNRKNEHFVGCLVGGEGSGKSYTAIRIAKEVDPSFDADRVIFDVIELLKILRRDEHEKGNFYVLDEAGVSMGNRTWHDRSQILANQALQTIRDENLGLIFTLPRWSELDSQARGRVQGLMELQEKQDGEYVSGEWKFLDPDRVGESGEIYKWHPRRHIDGRTKKIEEFSFRPPGGDIIDPYEDRKNEFQNNVYQQTIEASEGEGEDGEEMDVKEIAAEIKEERLEDFISLHGNTGKPFVDKGIIRVEYGTSHSDADAVKSLVERDLSEDELEAAV